jgi:hypothetical protein
LPSPDGLPFGDGRRASANLDAACAMGSVREAGGGTWWLIEWAACFGGALWTVFMLAPLDFGIYSPHGWGLKKFHGKQKIRGKTKNGRQRCLNTSADFDRSIFPAGPPESDRQEFEGHPLISRPISVFRDRGRPEALRPSSSLPVCYPDGSVALGTGLASLICWDFTSGTPGLMVTGCGAGAVIT